MRRESAAATLAAVHAFLARLLEDRVNGAEFPLEEYQRDYPGFEGAIAEAWAEVTGAAAPPDFGAPRSIGRFRVLRLIGRGGQGLVYLARDPQLNRDVALKLLSEPFGDSGAPRLRFQREAESAGRIVHPGICTIHEVGEHQGQPYIVMQYVAGESLAQWIARDRERVGDESERVAAAAGIAEHIARAVHVAHEAGVVHRDLKPSNVILSTDGRPVVLDFGLARDEADDAVSLTRSGETFGTPAYMAPEQIQLDGRRPDRRCDVFALGVLLYECLTLRRPFEAPTRTALARLILEEAPPSARRLCPAIARDLEVVLATALAKAPADRYQTALDLAEDLRRVAEKRPILARPLGRFTGAWRWSQRNPALALSLVGLFLALGLVLGVTAYHLRAARLSLDRIESLSDQRILPYLDRLYEQELWPAVPEKLPAMDAWLREAEAACARGPQRRRELAELQSQDSASALEKAQLAAVIDGLDSLAPHIDKMRERRELAESLTRRSIDEQRGVWERTIAAIATSPPYGGLRIAPQLGLVPLGPDPVSELFEFAALLTGEIPARDGAKGKLAFDEHSAVVLVLLPGGTFRMGASGSPDADLRESLPQVDVALEPFFLSKFEMTQAQWLRATGTNPSTYPPGFRYRGRETGITLTNPVETVSWDDCNATLSHLDLALPTEAQWEYACRAGTTTAWHTGDDIRSLVGYANFADEGSQEIQADSRAFEPGLADGWNTHAPAGSFLPNAFGLHDMHGNVFERCRDEWCSYAVAPRPGDGERACGEHPDFRICRGGDYYSRANDGRSAYRASNPAHMRIARFGLRPARMLR